MPKIRIYESPNTGMVEFASEAGVVLFSHPKNSMVIDSLEEDTKIRIFSGLKNNYITQKLNAADVLNSDGISYAATAEDLINKLNPFFFQLVEGGGNTNPFTYLVEEIETTSTTPTYITVYKFTEDKAMGCYWYAIGKVPQGAKAYSGKFVGGAVRQGNTTQILAANPDSLVNSNINGSITHRIDGTSYQIGVASDADGSSIKWRFIIFYDFVFA